MINYNIGIQLTKNSEKYLGLISSFKSNKNVNCINISFPGFLKIMKKIGATYEIKKKN